MTSRLTVVVIVLGSLLAGLLLDRSMGEDAPETPPPTVDASVFPMAASPGALSSTWFCAGGTADEEAFADHAVVVANPNATSVEVTVTAYGGVVAPPAVEVDPEDLDEDGGEGEDAAETDTSTSTTEAGGEGPEPVTRTIDVGPLSRESIALSELIEAPIASALVEASVGGIVVEHRVQSIHGFDAKPCATSASSTWHLAWGDTTADARELLVLFNPFPRDAIVDGRFSTEDGIREPQRFDGLVVPGRGTIAVDLGDDVTRREEVAGTITARAGRIVVDRILRVNSETERGLTVQLGVPEPQTLWAFPDGFTSESVREEYVVYNPGEQVAEVSIEFVTDDPETHGIPAPVDLSLAPGTHQVVDLTEDDRLPDAVAHSALVRSANGVPVVAERVLVSSGDERRGITVTTGSPVEADEWTFAVGSASETSDQWLVILNLDGQVLAEVDVVALAAGQRLPIADLQGIEIQPGQRVAIRLGEHIARPDLPIVVESTEPIVAERGLYRVGDDQRGASNAIGVPSAPGAVVPVDPLEVDASDVDLDGTVDPEGGGDDVPVAPDDVDLPDPDETIVIDDPDAEAEDPAATTTTRRPTSTTRPPEGGVPDTSP